jgi:hypothetical protein
MKQFAKARWGIDGGEIRLGMDFSKVDKKGRMVHGWATLDNVDTENDVVTAAASADAFARGRGNLREMHRKDSAVGRIVSFKEDKFRAPDGNMYNGIFVKVRISEGAEDTWKKVLDGTLNGFSIGGSIVDSEEVFSKDANANIRKVTKYDLTELSLVDNPGNQYSDVTNIFKLRKSADGSVTTLTGMVEDTRILNVFCCSNDNIIKEAAGDSYSCPVCETEMTEIGFVEDNGDRDGKVKALVTKFIGEGGDIMKKSSTVPEDQLETEATGHDPDDRLEVPTPAHRENDPEPEAPEVEEVEDAQDEISKAMDQFKKDIEAIVHKSNTKTDEKIEALATLVEQSTELLKEKTSEFDKRIAEIDKNLGVNKAKIAEFEKSFEKINSRDALKKSVDSAEGPAVPEQKNNPWEGSAFSINRLI